MTEKVTYSEIKKDNIINPIEWKKIKEDKKNILSSLSSESKKEYEDLDNKLKKNQLK